MRGSKLSPFRLALVATTLSVGCNLFEVTSSSDAELYAPGDPCAWEDTPELRACLGSF